MKLKPSIDGVIGGEATQITFAKTYAAIIAPQQLIVRSVTPGGKKIFGARSTYACELSRHGVQIDVDALPHSAR